MDTTPSLADRAVDDQSQLAFESALEVVGATEPTIADLIGAQLANQQSQLKLVASENYASPATLALPVAQVPWSKAPPTVTDGRITIEHAVPHLRQQQRRQHRWVPCKGQ